MPTIDVNEMMARSGLGVPATGNVPSGTLRGPEQRPEPHSLLEKALDIVSRPGYSTIGPLYEGLRSYQETGKIDWGRAASGFTEGLAGKQYMSVDVLRALDVHRSLQTHMTERNADTLMAGIGLVGDILLDWTNLLGVGAVRAAVKSTAGPATKRGAALLAGSKTFTGVARMFNASFGMPEGYHDIKYFWRHALDAELTEVLKTTGDMAKRLPVRDRQKVMEQLGKPGLPPADWDDEMKAVFGELRVRLQDIGEKWVQGGWMNRQSLKNAMEEGYDPRYYMLWDAKAKKWFVDEAGPHGIPGSIFDKTATPEATKRRHFKTTDEARKYFVEKGAAVVDDITKTPKGLKSGIHVGTDPIYGYALRASSQARFMANQGFVDEVLTKFGVKATDPGEILDGITHGSLMYKMRKLEEDVGFYLPKGALKFYTNTMVSDDKLKTLLRTFGAEARAAKEGQLPKILKIARKQMEKLGFSEGERDLLLQWMKDTGGVGVDIVLKDVSAMREVIRRLAVASEGPLIELEKFEQMAEGLGKRMVGVSKNVPIYKLPRSIAQDVNKLRFVETDEGARLLRKVFDDSLNVWKGYATVANPGFHFRNSYSNWFNMYLADVNPLKLPQRVKQAMNIQLGGGGKLSDTLTYEQVADEIKRLGIRGKGWAGADIVHTFQSDMQKALRGGVPKMRELFNPVNHEFFLILGGRKLGTAIEDNSRIALYIDRRLKGDTARDAALKVRKYLFDYDELTKTERDVFKRIWPFYTWMRKNIPLQFEHLVTKPYKYSSVAKTIRAIGYVDPETEQERSVRPDYFDSLAAFKTPMQNAFKGVPVLGTFFESDHPIYLNPNFPFQDLNRVEMRDLLASLNPFLKISVELGPTLVGGTGFEAFSRRPLYKYPGDRDALPPGLVWLGDLPDPIKDVIGVGPTLDLTEGREVVGMDARWLHTLKSLNPFFMNMARAVPELGTGQAPSRYEDRLRFYVLSWLLGIKLMPLDLAKSEVAKMLQTKSDMDKLKKYLRYESPTTGEVHDLLMEFEEKHFPESRLDRMEQVRRSRKNLLGQASK